MSKFECKYCGMCSPVYAEKGPHIGEWCSFCKRWIRWVPKNFFNQPVEKHVEKPIEPQSLRPLDTDFDDEVPWYD